MQKTVRTPPEVKLQNAAHAQMWYERALIGSGTVSIAMAGLPLWLAWRGRSLKVSLASSITPVALSYIPVYVLEKRRDEALNLVRLIQETPIGAQEYRSELTYIPQAFSKVDPAHITKSVEGLPMGDTIGLMGRKRDLWLKEPWDPYPFLSSTLMLLFGYAGRRLGTLPQRDSTALMASPCIWPFLWYGGDTLLKAAAEIGTRRHLFYLAHRQAVMMDTLNTKRLEADDIAYLDRAGWEFPKLKNKQLANLVSSYTNKKKLKLKVADASELTQDGLVDAFQGFYPDHTAHLTLYKARQLQAPYKGVTLTLHR